MHIYIYVYTHLCKYRLFIPIHIHMESLYTRILNSMVCIQDPNGDCRHRNTTRERWGRQEAYGWDQSGLDTWSLKWALGEGP